MADAIAPFRNEFLEDMFPTERLTIPAVDEQHLLSGTSGVFSHDRFDSYQWSVLWENSWKRPETEVAFLSLHKAGTFFKMTASLPIMHPEDIAFTEPQIVEICNHHLDRLFGDNGYAEVFFVRQLPNTPTFTRGPIDIIMVSFPYGTKEGKRSRLPVAFSPKSFHDRTYWKQHPVYYGPPDCLSGKESGMKEAYTLVVPSRILPRTNRG